MVTDECSEKCWTPVRCAKCRKNKAPVGRDVPAAMGGGFCDGDCDGYRQEPYPPHLWASEAPDL